MDRDVAKASLVMMKIERLMSEARVAAADGDITALEAVQANMVVLHEEMVEIRRAQLERLARTADDYSRPRKRRWWRRG